MTNRIWGYDHGMSIVAEMKKGRRTITKRNKTIAKLEARLQEAEEVIKGYSNIVASINGEVIEPEHEEQHISKPARDYLNKYKGVQR